MLFTGSATVQRLVCRSADLSAVSRASRERGHGASSSPIAMQLRGVCLSFLFRVWNAVAARATERGLQSAGVFVSEGPVAVTAETERNLRSRLAALCRGLRSDTAEGGGFGVFAGASVPCSRSCGINPAPLPRSWLGRRTRTRQIVASRTNLSSRRGVVIGTQKIRERETGKILCVLCVLLRQTLNVEP